ncbi:hypothetical protein MRB53_014270 [Persea americana]|uniref:Uncharacterized protein n=1 Tax=Persea americana TaxID=3435 RepID=A0ACC2KAA5_PERAE|nr:hypothetical protein MRB53_014270 [Persea americana]
MEHLGTVFEMGKAICAPLQSLKENEDILDKKIEELSCRESDVRADLEREKLQYGKMPKREVELWLKNVQNIKDKVHDIKQKLREVREASWTHIQLRMNLAKEVEVKIKEAVELKENGRFQEGLLVDLLLGSIETFPPIRLVGETTALKNLKKIEECLMEDEVGKIGVYGMGGVGKTTIMTHIHNKFKNARTFNHVIWVTVSKESDLEELHDRLSKALGIDLSNYKDALYDEIVCDSLIEKWMADGFFDEIEDREKGFDKGYTIINDLKDACMLENGERNLFSGSCVKMHDLLRDLAIAITRKSNQFVVKVRSNVGKFPRDKNLMDDVIRVSLMHSDIEMLSCQSKCPKLSTLLLDGSRLGNIDHLFFEHMQNLQVLDLSNAYITFLPQSLSNLVNLHALLLRDCQHLAKVPSLVELRELRVLDLTRTAIKYLPDGMAGLTNLRCLGLSLTKSLEMVPVGAISSLSHLEELSMMGSKWKWSSKENRNGRGAGVEDIVRLMHLKKLLVEFDDLSAFSTYVGSGHWRGLNCFFLAVDHGHDFNHLGELQYDFYCRECRVCVSGMLQQAHNMNSVAFPGSNLTDLEITFLHDLRTIYMEEPTQGDTLANLKRIRISNCPKLKYVLSVGWFQTLQNLEVIDVEGCQAMEEMVVDTGLHKEEPTQGDTLAKLKRIRISNCPKLKYVLSVGWFQTLQNLEEIAVFNCQAMEEMVVDTGLHKEEPTQGDTLAKLKRICIAHCPKLKYVLSVGWFQTLQNLKEIYVDYCQAMEEIVVDTGLHKEEPTQGDTLANLKRIRISNCPKLKYVLSVGWFQTLQNLEEIDVEGCQAMEEMVVDMGDISEANNNIPITLPRLEVTLSRLPKLKSIFYHPLSNRSSEEAEDGGTRWSGTMPTPKCTSSLSSQLSNWKKFKTSQILQTLVSNWKKIKTSQILQTLVSNWEKIKKDSTSNSQSVQTTVSKGKKIKKDREPKEKHIASPNGPQLAPTFPGAAARRE